MPPKAKSSRAGKAPSSETPQRRSTRAKAPPAKSPYVEPSSGDDEDVSDFASKEGVSDYENNDAYHSAPETSAESQHKEEEVEEIVVPKKRARAPTNASRPTKKNRQGEGEVFFPYRAPTPGDVEYADDRIHPNTLTFLEELAKNNERSWLHENDSIYRAGKADFEKFVESLNEVMPQQVDDTLPELPIKDLTFRINRDIRFSNDRTPYKTHFSAAWSRTGKKGHYACYFLQVKPGQSVAGGGLWHPEPSALNLIRRSIDKHPERLKGVLTGEAVAAEFFHDLPKKDEKSIVKAFANRNGEDALKTAPKSYSKDHTDIELLRLKSFTISKKISDKDVISTNFLNIVTGIFKNMEPLITYLNSVVMPDDNDNSDSSED